MFFNFAQFFANQGPNLAYEEFLSRGELSLADILRHEDTVSEVRKNNAALLRIVKGEIPTLLGYISAAPALDTADARSFPFVSSEILKSEALLSEFGRSPELLPQVFSFLQTENDLNPTVAGYCSDLCLKLLDRLGFHAVDCVFRGETDYCMLLARHARQRSVAELIVGILSVNTMLQQRQRLFSAVLSRLKGEMERVEAVSVGFIVTEVLRRSMEVGEWRYLAAVLLSKSIIEVLSAAALSEVSGDQVGAIVTALLSHAYFGEVLGCQSEEFLLYERLKPLLETALQGLPCCGRDGFDYCESTAPLGQTRLALIQMINAGVKVIGPELDGLLIEHGYLHTVTQLFLAYPWHSSLHHAFEFLVRTVIEDSSHCLRVELMEKLALISVLVGATKANAAEPRMRKGYMGHLTRVGNLLLAASSTSPYLRELMAQADWQYFATFYLTAQNRIELEKYLASEKDSECSSVEVLRDVEVLPDNGEEYEFRLEPQLLSLDTDFAGFESDLVSSDPEVEVAQGSDIYNSLNYWELPIPAEALPDLD